MSTKVILIIIATINPSEKDSLTYYLQEMNKLYQEVGANQIKKYQITESLIGEDTANLVSIMEFPNREAMEKVFKSEEYKKLVPYREKAFIKVTAMISE